MTDIKFRWKCDGDAAHLIVIHSWMDYAKEPEQRWHWEVDGILEEATDAEGQTVGWGVTHKAGGFVGSLEDARYFAKEAHAGICAGAIAHQYPDEMIPEGT